MLETIKILLAITDSSKDNLLNTYIYMVQEEIMNYCGITSVPDELANTVNYMVICKYSQEGAAGLSSASFGGVSESYTKDYPQFIISSLNRYRKMRTL